MPTEAPMMPASARGVSITRRPPKRRCSPSVTRKTPPSTPTSSPMMTMSGSRSISSSRARFSALTMLSFAMARSVRAVRGAESARPSRGRALPAHGRRGGPGGVGRVALRGVLQACLELRALGNQMRGQLGVDLIEHAERIGGGQGLEPLHPARDLLVHLSFDGGVEELLALEIGAEARERILLLPRLDFLLRTVLGRIVRRGVHGQSIGDALDEGGPVTRARPVHRLAARRVDGKHVVAVDLDARETVGGGLLGDGARVGLLLDRHGDRPLVVLAEEHHGTVPHPGEVGRLVEVALGSGAVAEVRHDHRVLAAVLDPVGDAHGVRELGRHGNGHGQVTLLRRRLPTLETPRVEGEELLDGPTPPEHGRRLPEGRYQPIPRLQRAHAADLRGLLPLDGGEGADPALALEPQHALVEAPSQQHAAVEAQELFGRELRLEGGVEISLAVEDRQALDGKLRLDEGSGHGRPDSLLSYLIGRRPTSRSSALASDQYVNGTGNGGRPQGRPPLTVSHGTSLFVAGRLLPRVSTNSTGPSTMSKIEMSAGAPTWSVPSPGTRPTILAGSHVARETTSSSGMPRARNFDITLGRVG